MDASLKTIRERQNALKIGPPVSMPLMQAASEYRTGLQIFWLANLALRLRNLGMAELGRHLTESDPWWLTFSRHKMKGKSAYDRPISDELAKWTKIYLEEVRPLLARGKYSGMTKVSDKELWVSSRGTPQTNQSIRKNIQKLTGREFKRPISPHWFRDAVATTIARKWPEDAGKASWLLTNTQDMVEAVYSHAGPGPARMAVSKRLTILRAGKFEHGLRQRGTVSSSSGPGPQRMIEGDHLSNSVARKPVLGRVIARLKTQGSSS